MLYAKTIQVVRQTFLETMTELDPWFELSEESRCYQLQDDGWSIQQILEHITLTIYTVRMSVQNLGKMDMYQWLYFLALHQRRHIAQMEQVFQEWQQHTS